MSHRNKFYRFCTHWGMIDYNRLQQAAILGIGTEHVNDAKCILPAYRIEPSSSYWLQFDEGFIIYIVGSIKFVLYISYM